MTQTHELSPNTHGHTHRIALLVLGGLALAVLLHVDAGWWTAPLAILAAGALLHLVVGGALLLVGAVLLRRRGRPEGVPRGQLIRWPRLYDGFVRVLSRGRESRLRARWLELAAPQPGEVVLDVGCGTGTLLLAAAERVGEEGTLRGIDGAPEMIERARAKARARGVTNMELAVGSADRLPYPDASCDVVLCTLVLHHLPPDLQRAALAEMRRVARPGARAVIVDLSPRTGLLQRLGSLVALVHGDAVGRVIELEAALRSLGAREITVHDSGMGALAATRARFP